MSNETINFENLLRFDEVTTIHLIASCLLEHNVNVHVALPYLLPYLLT